MSALVKAVGKTGMVAVLKEPPWQASLRHSSLALPMATKASSSSGGTSRHPCDGTGCYG